MGSLRVRLTTLATALIVTVLVASSALLFVLQTNQLSRNIDRSLAERADTIEDLLRLGSLPTSLDSDDDDRAVQVVNAAGEVVGSSDNVVGEPPVADLPESVDELVRTVEEFPADDDAFRLLSRRVRTSEGVFVIHLAESSDDLDETTQSLLVALGVAVPGLAVLFAGLTWWLVGRTLRPVEVMRSEVEAISDNDELHQIAHPGRNDEIGRLSGTLNGMLSRLHRSGEQQRQFVADAAHELRTPLTRIRTTVEVDLAQPDSAVPARTNTEVLEEIVGLQQLIDDLLHLARSDVAGSFGSGAVIDFDDVVMTEVREHRHSAESIEIDATAVSGCELAGDEAQLARAVQNLLSNAVRHATSRVAVSLRNDSDGIRLIVDDDGAGVAPSDREAIFDRFTRLDHARSAETGGAGLGLAITRGIVRFHGGTIRCEASPLGGARFEALFPPHEG